MRKENGRAQAAGTQAARAKDGVRRAAGAAARAGRRAAARARRWALDFATKNVIRKKLMLYFLTVTLLVNFISFYTYRNTQLLTGKLSSIFQNDIALTALSNRLDTVETSLKGYLTTAHSEDLRSYLAGSDGLRDDSESLSAPLEDDEAELLFLDIRNMIGTYLKDCDSAVAEKRGRDITAYTGDFNEASTLYGYINTYIDKLKIFEFQENNQSYLVLSSQLRSLEFFNMMAILFGMLLGLLLILWFAYSIAEPILKVSSAADAIARGDLSGPPVTVATRDEVGALARNFNRMAESLRRQMVELREKSELERRLHEKELQNLRTEALLKETQLRALQMQINPHFMFNTLNAGMQLAMFEGADRTQDFLMNLSESLRYNLRDIDRPATLEQELANVENYVFLLHERFGDKLRFVKEIPGGLPQAAMPRMILQPIVENAFVHGVNPREGGGTIRLRAEAEEGLLCVFVEDDGPGMPSSARAAALAPLGSEQAAREEETDGENRVRSGSGIGLRNVVERLMLFYHEQEAGAVLRIGEAPGGGTRVTVLLRPGSGEGETQHETV